jgi:hypothetical protein
MSDIRKSSLLIDFNLVVQLISLTFHSTNLYTYNRANDFS